MVHIHNCKYLMRMEILVHENSVRWQHVLEYWILVVHSNIRIKTLNE